MMGNKVTKLEGYRFFMSTFSSVRELDGVETSGDTDNEPSGQLRSKVKPLSEVLRYYDMKKKLMENPELMAQAQAQADAMDAAEAAEEDESETGSKKGDEEKEEEEEDEELFFGAVRVIIGDLTKSLTRCFEGTKMAQAVMAKVDVMIDKLVEAKINDRVMFLKGTTPEEVI